MILEGKKLHSDQAIEWRVLPKDWKRFPFGSHSFDAIIASSVFEYLDDVDGVLRECARVLTRAGKLIFSVPNPCHLSRKWERYFRPLAKATLKISPLDRLPKIGSYLSYLCLSSVRLSEADWREKAACAGLRQVDGWGANISDQNRSMLYLVFEVSA
jgi:ubiquinone/menaquinone biosynthesis C-methylase UbiE